MKTIMNPARARLEAGEVSIGVGLRVSRTVDIAKAMKTAGYDWLFIDLEHSPISIDTAANDYGVIITADLNLDEAATAQRRAD